MVASVPDVGNVTFVAPVIVNTELKAPLVCRFPARVNVLDPLLTPVPPLAGAITPVIPTVIDPLALATKILVPEFIAVATGSPDVVPTKTCPAPNTIEANKEEASPINTPCAVREVNLIFENPGVLPGAKS